MRAKLASIGFGLGSDDFEVVALSEDLKGTEASAAFLKDAKAENLALYVDPKANALAAVQSVGLPTTLLIDRNGKDIALIRVPVSQMEGPAWAEDGRSLVHTIRSVGAPPPLLAVPSGYRVRTVGGDPGDHARRVEAHRAAFAPSVAAQAGQCLVAWHDFEGGASRVAYAIVAGGKPGAMKVCGAPGGTGPGRVRRGSCGWSLLQEEPAAGERTENLGLALAPGQRPRSSCSRLLSPSSALVWR